MEPGVVLTLLALALIAVVARQAPPSAEPQAVPVRVTDQDDADHS